MRFASWFLGLSFLLLTVTGCSDKDKARAKVKGQVKFFDKHLTAGTVSFVASDGRVGAGNIDFDGNYEVSDAPIGDVTITVKVPNMMGMKGPGGGSISPKAPAGLPPMQGGGDGEKNAPPSIDAKKIVNVPAKYASADTSGLKYVVEPGMNEKNITLTP